MDECVTTLGGIGGASSVSMSSVSISSVSISVASLRGLGAATADVTSCDSFFGERDPSSSLSEELSWSCNLRLNDLLGNWERDL